ncbi:hypothetical protein [Mesorhizobium sp.]|uniref:hypothetical protein n=1 Tax=Mesorhizobium sp. TaxID=1871066 RepID=UPI0025D4944E|nr:hypothetical protein [Mesorhizobium sp.]
MKALSLSKSTPSRGKGKSERARLIATITLPLSRVRTGTHSVQPVAISVSTIVCTKLPDEDVPEWADKIDFDEAGLRIIPIPEGPYRHRSADRRTHSRSTTLAAMSHNAHHRQKPIHRRRAYRQQLAAERVIDL